MAPVHYAYTSHLMATALRQPFAYGLAAVLPCYWIYLEVGKELKKKGSKNPDYQRWIDSYSSEGYAQEVAAVLAIMDTEAARLDTDSLRTLKHLFRTSARYEWMSWQLACPEATSLPQPSSHTTL